MNLNRIKVTMATGMLAAGMILPGMSVCAAKPSNANLALQPTINKTVKVADGVTLPDQSISFTGTLVEKNTTDNKYYNADGVQVPSDAPESLTISSANFKNLTKTSKATDSDVEGSALTQQLSFTGAPTAVGEYTYEITEGQLPALVNGYGWTQITEVTTADGNKHTFADGTAKYYLHILITNKTSGGTTTTYYVTLTNAASDIKEDSSAPNEKYFEDSNKVTSIDFVNKYTKRGGSDKETPDPANPDDSNKDDYTAPSLKITKAVTNGEYVAANTEYEFKVEITPDTNGLNPTTAATGSAAYYSYKVYNAGGTEDSTASGNLAATNGKVTDGRIKLKDGQYAVFCNIPAGNKVKVTEVISGKDYYTAGNMTQVDIAYKSNDVSQKNIKVEKANLASGAATNGFTIGEKANEVTFTNTYQKVTVTGVVTNIAPYVTLVIVAVAAVAAYMGIKNRIAR